MSQNPKGPETLGFLQRLPFALTVGQKKAWNVVQTYLMAKRPMSLLLQGDVGSGKTVIAVLAMLAALDAGHQAAFMAPTELLAEQQWRVLSAWLEPAQLAVGLLRGKRSDRSDQDSPGSPIGSTQVSGRHASVGLALGKISSTRTSGD